MIILTKFYTNLKIYKLQDIYYKCIMEVFEQSITLLNHKYLMGSFLAIVLNLRRLFLPYTIFFTMLNAYICGKCLLTLMNIF